MDLFVFLVAGVSGITTQLDRNAPGTGTGTGTAAATSERSPKNPTMGAMMPLPERVPRPVDQNQRAHLESMVFVVGCDAKDAKNTKNAKDRDDADASDESSDESSDEDDGYVTLTLPEGMEWRSVGFREDLPDWHVVSKDGEKSFVNVFGSWKGTYDNHLDMRMTPEGVPGDFASTRGTEEHSQTSGPAMAVKLADALDPRSDANEKKRSDAHRALETALEKEGIARVMPEAEAEAEEARGIDPNDAAAYEE